MIKDLFSLLFTELSEFTAEEYQTHFVERLPSLMLGAATQAIADTALLVGLDDVELSFNASTAHWRNPELYPHLNLLGRSHGCESQAHLDALRVHLNLLSPMASLCRSRYLRLRAPQPRVLEKVGSSMRDVHKAVCLVQRKTSLFVYSPHPHLFHDVAHGLYHASEVRQETVESLGILVCEAIDLLACYSDELANAVLDTIGTIAFTSDELSVTRSFSMRTAYPGAVFSAICDRASLAENLLHEHYHCRLWRWWLAERPPDLPSDEIVINSPLTGMKRPVSVMMHALLIYVSLVDYYRTILSYGSLHEIEHSSASLRLDQLETSTTSLIDALHVSLRDRPFCARFVAILSDVARTSQM
jgi:hypothetical protein